MEKGKELSMKVAIEGVGINVNAIVTHLEKEKERIQLANVEIERQNELGTLIERIEKLQNDTTRLMKDINKNLIL